MKTHEDIKALAERIQQYADGRRWALAKLVREFPSLGSERAFRDMRDGRFEDYNLETQEANLRAAVALIEVLSESAPGEGICETLGPVAMLTEAVKSLVKTHEASPARVVVCLGESGIGKTTAARTLVGKFGATICMMEANVCVGDTPNAFLGALLVALGRSNDDIPGGKAARLGMAVAMLNAKRRCVIIDEAHHLGRDALNTVKALVNLTPGGFVLLCIPTLWKRLESAAFMEARQLTTNRLHAMIELELGGADVAQYLIFMRPDLFDEAKKSAQPAMKILAAAKRPGGNFAFVRDVVRALESLESVAFEKTLAEITRKRGGGK